MNAIEMLSKDKNVDPQFAVLFKPQKHAEKQKEIKDTIKKIVSGTRDGGESN
jgi:hypothetical protein